jgi:F-type H+-transporting ATPase subunit b
MTTYPLAAGLAASGEEINPIVPAPAEIVIGFIAFGLLYWLLRRYAFPSFEKMFAERTAAIEGGMAKAEQAQADAAAALETYQAQLADARQEAARIREEAREQGAAIIAEMREQAQGEAGRITAANQQQLEVAKQQAIAQLRGQVGTLAVDLASKVVGESLDDDARARATVDRFIADLEAQAAAEPGGQVR